MIDIEKVLQLRREGFSFRQIARQMNVSHVGIIKKLRKSGNSAKGGNSEFLKKVSRVRPLEEKTPPYFIKEGTDEIFGYTKFLAERADMKPFFGTLEEFRAKGKA